MIISHSRKFIFVHLHKTAGSSVKQAILPFLEENDVVIGSGPKDSSRPGRSRSEYPALHKHSSARRIRNAIGRETWDGYFKFSVVRHPFERLVSLYEFLKRIKRNQISKASFLERWLSMIKPGCGLVDPTKSPWKWDSMQALLTTKSFSEFIRSQHLAQSQDAKPQSELLSDSEGNIIVDFVGKLEDISEDWKTISGKLGIDTELGHVNRSPRESPNQSDYWDEANVQFAVERYREDFERFGYTLED